MTSMLAACQSLDVASLRKDNSRLPLEWENGDRATVVPFTLVDNHVVVPVSVNGGAPLDFVLDSGAGTSILFESRHTVDLAPLAGEEIPLAGSSSGATAMGRVAGGLTLEFGSLRVPGLSLIYLPVESVPYFDSIDQVYFDGVLGGTFFERLQITIDYHDEVVVFAEPGAETPPAQSLRDDWESLPLRVKDGRAYLSADVGLEGGQAATVKLLVATGARGLVSLTPATDEQLSLPQDFFPTRSRDFSGEVLARVGIVPWLELGPYRLDDLPVEFRVAEEGPANGANGILANEVLNRFHQRFDFANRRLDLAPNHRFAAPLTADRSGLQIRAHSAGGIVERVAAGSAGAAVGLVAGDVITSFDGTPATPETITLLKRELASERDAVTLCWRARIECRCADIALASRFRRDPANPDAVEDAYKPR